MYGKKRWSRRGQAAIEFLSTYGWAILVVLITVSALGYFGVLNPAKLLPESCLTDPHFRCKDWMFDSQTDQVRVVLTNNHESEVQITAVRVFGERIVGQCVRTDPITIRKGFSGQIDIQCDSGALEAFSGKERFSMTMDYRLVFSDLEHTLDIEARTSDSKGMIPPGSAVPASCVDNDGDGHYAYDAVDCDTGDDPDDNDAYTYPGAPEVCDDVDNDGNSNVDEGCDDDNDNFCDASMTVLGTPATCTFGGGDCADTDGTRYPGADELCDNVDNDCDGAIDESVTIGAPPLVPDFGVCGGQPKTCQAGAWIDDYSVIGNDYEATEVSCSDGLDNDCDDEPDCGDPDCAAFCTLCGNGVLDVSNGEECDDGNTDDGDGCTSGCHRMKSASCRQWDYTTQAQCEAGVDSTSVNCVWNAGKCYTSQGNGGSLAANDDNCVQDCDHWGLTDCYLPSFGKCIDPRFEESPGAPVAPGACTCRQHDGDQTACQAESDIMGVPCVYAWGVCIAEDPTLEDWVSNDNNPSDCQDLCNAVYGTTDCWITATNKCVDIGREACNI